MIYEFQHFGSSEYFRKEAGKNLNFPNHLHQSFEVVTILSGSTNITIDNKLHRLHPNDSVLIFPNQIHSFECNECEHLLYIFSPELVKSFSTKTSKKIPINNFFKLDNYFLDAYKKLSENDSKIKKKGMLYLICASFDEQAEYVEKCNEDKNLLHTIFNFVETNYDKDCSLEHLSLKTTYSYSYLSRYFKNTVGISFNAYVNQYRISKACYILTNSNCSILQCALECGYNSLRSFNRNFMSILSVSPKEYRERKDFCNE